MKTSFAMFDTLRKIDAVRTVTMAAIEESIVKTGIRESYPDAKPSEWLSVYTLRHVHKIKKRTLKALVTRGLLEERPTDGWGEEVRITDEGRKYLEI